MKKLLLSALLVSNAVPALAAQADWCKGLSGCASFTALTDAMRITAAAQKEALAKRKQDELDNVPNRDQIIAMTQATLESNEGALANLQQVYKKEDAAIDDVNAKDVNSLAALLAACKNGAKEKCAEHKDLIDNIFQRFVISNQRAIKQGTSVTERAGLVLELEEHKKAMLSAYEEMKAIAMQESQEIAPIMDDRNKATLACDEGAACNERIEALDISLNKCKEVAQAKRRDAKAKLDNAWKDYIVVRNKLNDVSDITDIEQTFPIQYSHNILVQEHSASVPLSPEQPSQDSVVNNGNDVAQDPTKKQEQAETDALQKKEETQETGVNQ